MRGISGGVTAAKGFSASGINAGIKKSRKPDLSLVVSGVPASVTAVFTENRVQAAPVLISKARAAKGQARAVLINSGCANCLTGIAGMRDALLISRAASKALAIGDGQLLLGSTGIIGRRLAAGKIIRAIPRLVGRLSPANHEAAAQAILTTDLHPKEAAVEFVVGSRKVRIGGMAKGAGMIAPSMATMLCVITTDAQVPAAWLSRLLKQVCRETFNRISVDGDMSTNDTVFLLANGRSGVTIKPGSAAAAAFARGLQQVAQQLSLMIVKDGEGATKIMQVNVVGARTQAEAQSCARQIACSPLVKTMLAGSDPNVGRIAGAAGASAARFEPARLEIHVNGVRLVAKGAALAVSASVTRRLLARPQVEVAVNLHAGPASAQMITCDLTAEYVRINAGYAT